MTISQRTLVWLTGTLALLPAALLVNPATASQSTEPTVVRTDAGLVRGQATGGARVFNGIPYAAPPGRWQSPRPARPWHGVRDASELSKPCAQQDNLEVPGGSPAEDCLYLNLTTPASESKRPRAVVVWIPGGRFFSGAGNSYGAAKLAKRGDLVVVTVNYRLGIFGVLRLPRAAWFRHLRHPGPTGGTALGAAERARLRR